MGRPDWESTGLGDSTNWTDIAIAIQQALGPAGWHEDWNHMGSTFYFKDKRDLTFFKLKFG